MAALTADRNTPFALGADRVGDVAADTVIYAGALVMRNSAGNLIEGATATGLIGAGVALERVDNTGGSAGDKSVRYRTDVARFANSASGDLITKADIGAVCYAVDDQTVAKTDGSAARSPAGIVDSVDDQGVWVRFDEALTALATA